jgi:hypothetical protein
LTDVITVGYEFGTQWRWQITVDPTDAETLRLGMDNLIPVTRPARAPPPAPIRSW